MFPTIGAPTAEEKRKMGESNEDVGGKTTKKKKKKVSGFQSMGLSKKTFGALMRIGFRAPTPIQRSAIPVALTGSDVVAMARTGSGKTAAFVVPMIERLKSHSVSTGVRGLILAPTRELALQSLKFTSKIAKFTDLRCCLIVGGESMNAQFDALAANPDLIVATPGRLGHLLQEIPTFSLKAVEMLVLDEADRLFEMGFAEQIQTIMDSCRESRQTMLVSATMPKVLAEFTHAGLREPTFVRLDAETKISPTLRLAFFNVRQGEKPAAFLHLVREVLPQNEQTIVFVATRHHVQFLQLLLENVDVRAMGVYGSMDMVARKRSVAMFRKKKVNLLIVTDVAARGLDIPLLKNVIHYDFPAKPKLFVHRAGRAGRQRRIGTVFALASPTELPYMVDLFLFLGRSLRLGNEDSDGDAGEDVATEQTRRYSLVTMTPDDVHYGRLPQSCIDEASESFHSILRAHLETREQYRVSNNAYKAYNRSRPPASRLSFLRAKDLGTHRLHPLFCVGDVESKAIVSVQDSVAKISKYRPSSTIIEVASLKSGKGPSAIMKEKRLAHQSSIAQTNVATKKSALPTKAKQDLSISDTLDKSSTEPRSRPSKRRISKAERKRMRSSTGANGPNALIETDEQRQPGKKRRGADFRDEKYYVSTGPQSRADAIGESAMTVSGCIDQRRRDIDNAAFDVMGDEVDRLKRDKQRRFLWDAKRGRYVKTSAEELRKSRALSKRHRSDQQAGRVTKKEEFGKHYARWTKRSKRHVGSVGEIEDGGSLDCAVDPMKELTLPHTRRVQRSVANAGVKGEVKSASDIRKRRKEKEKRQQRGKKKGRSGVAMLGLNGRRGGGGKHKKKGRRR